MPENGEKGEQEGIQLYMGAEPERSTKDSRQPLSKSTGGFIQLNRSKRGLSPANEATPINKLGIPLCQFVNEKLADCSAGLNCDRYFANVGQFPREQRQYGCGRMR
jgi:hypothetical protein